MKEFWYEYGDIICIMAAGVAAVTIINVCFLIFKWLGI